LTEIFYDLTDQHKHKLF